MREALIPLTCTQAGQRVCVSTVGNGHGLQSRLHALGLAPGMRAEVVSVGAGPVILNVLGSRLALGHGMAEQVWVRPLANRECGHRRENSGIRRFGHVSGEPQIDES